MIEYTLRRAGEPDTAEILALVRRAGLSLGTIGFDPTRFVVAESRGGEIIGCAQLKPHVGGYLACLGRR